MDTPSIVAHRRAGKNASVRGQQPFQSPAGARAAADTPGPRPAVAALMGGAARFAGERRSGFARPLPLVRRRTTAASKKPSHPPLSGPNANGVHVPTTFKPGSRSVGRHSVTITHHLHIPSLAKKPE
ncbi:hypothetical protein SEVIR_4G277640v4 [Setaria viridis]